MSKGPDTLTASFLVGFRQLIESAGMALEEVAEIWEVSVVEAEEMLKGETPARLADVFSVWVALKDREFPLEQRSPGHTVALLLEALVSVGEKLVDQRGRQSSL